MPIKPFAKPMPRASMLLFVMLTLSGCGTMTGSAVIEPVSGAETFCRVAKPITWSSHDTDETIAGVKSHNEVWKRLCSAQ